MIIDESAAGTFLRFEMRGFEIRTSLPVIGITGGIGSGKSHVAAMFGELGCRVIDSDQQVRAAYAEPAVRAQLRQWWGEGVFHSDGSVNRRAVADHVFGPGADADRGRLEAVLHARVADMRDAAMDAAAADPAVVAVVWDTPPLLVETSLHAQCDAVVFVDAPDEVRAVRVRTTRNWPDGELARREKIQLSLDNKRAMADYVVVNTAGAEPTRSHVRDVLSRILEKQSN